MYAMYDGDTEPIDIVCRHINKKLEPFRVGAITIIIDAGFDGYIVVLPEVFPEEEFIFVLGQNVYTTDPFMILNELGIQAGLYFRNLEVPTLTDNIILGYN